MCLLNYGQFICHRVSFLCIIRLLFGCQYQCNQLPGNTRLPTDLTCYVALYSLASCSHSSLQWRTQSAKGPLALRRKIFNLIVLSEFR